MPRTPSKLTHLDAANRPTMVDVGAKTATLREASAEAVVKLPPAVARELKRSGHRTKKGPVFDTAIVADDVRPYFRDVYDHVVRVNETIDTLRELVTGALEAKLSLLSLAQNDVTKQLAAWAAILAVPTMIAGVYGMNFDFMPELHWRYGYLVIMFAMASACGFLYWRFKKAGWL